MMTSSTKALLLGLAVAMTPALQGEVSPAPAGVAAKADKTTKLLDASFDSLAKVLEESHEKVAESEAQRKLAVAELDARREAHAQTQHELAELKKQLAATQKSETHWKNQSEKLTKKLAAGEEAHANLAKFRDQMAVTLNEFASLKGDIADVRGELEAPAERVALKKQNANLRTVKAQLEKRLHETQNQLVAERKEHTKTRDQLTATARQNDILANALAESKGAINSLRTKLEEAGRSLSISESNSQEAIQNSALLEKLASRLQHEHSKMGRELASAVTAREEAQGKLAGVEAARKEAEGKANQLSSKLQTAHADLSTLQREKAELLKTINTKATALKAAKQQYNAEVARSNQRHQEATAQILAMKKNGEAESKKNAELLAQTELNGIEGAESVQAELKEMTKLRGDLQKSNAALKALQNDTLELRNISDLTAERLKRTRQQVVAMSEEKQALKEALKKRESEIAELQANLDKSHISETAQTEQQEE